MKNPYFSLLAISWKHSSKTNKRKYIVVYLLFFVTNAVTILFPLLYGWLVESLQYHPENAFQHLWIFVGSYFGLTAIKWAFHGPGRIMERKLAFDISSSYLNSLVNKLVHEDINWHKSHHSGAIINRLRKSHVGLRNFFENGFIYFETIMQLIIAMTAMIIFAPQFGCIAVILGLSSIWINLQFDKPYIKSLQALNEKEHEISASLTDVFGNILTVITLRLGKYIQNDLQQKLKNMFPIYHKVSWLGEWKWLVANLLVVTIYLTIIVGYVYTNYNSGNSFNLGRLVTLVTFVTQFNSAFYMVALQYTQVIQLHSDVNTARIIEEKLAIEKKNPTIFLPQGWKRIEVKNLSFDYAVTPVVFDTKEKKKVIDDISFFIKRGKHIALIGKSGVGKSTLLSLLRGLYPLKEAPSISTDGVSSEWTTITESTMLFPQDPEIFENTVLFNLTMGLQTSEEELIHACRLACIDELINKLPDGFHTVIKERGNNFSGGEKQRIALARGILASKNSSILLMDEPTSNVDHYTEQKIYFNLTNHLPGKTIISTLHNKELLAFFPVTFNLFNGKIENSDKLHSISE